MGIWIRTLNILIQKGSLAKKNLDSNTWHKINNISKTHQHGQHVRQINMQNYTSFAKYVLKINWNKLSRSFRNQQPRVASNEIEEKRKMKEITKMNSKSFDIQSIYATKKCLLYIICFWSGTGKNILSII